MTDRHDGSSIDLERELVRYLGGATDHPPLPARADRDLAGAAAALAPVIAACTGSKPRRRRQPRPLPPAASAPPAASGGRRPRRLPAHARADARSHRPRASCSSTTGRTTWARTSIPSFEKKYGIKVTYDFFDNYDTMLAKIGQGGGGYDVTFPTSTDIPGLRQRAA